MGAGGERWRMKAVITKIHFFSSQNHRLPSIEKVWTDENNKILQYLLHQFEMFSLRDARKHACSHTLTPHARTHTLTHAHPHTRTYVRTHTHATERGVGEEGREIEGGRVGWGRERREREAERKRKEKEGWSWGRRGRERKRDRGRGGKRKIIRIWSESSFDKRTRSYHFCSFTEGQTLLEIIRWCDWRRLCWYQTAGRVRSPNYSSFLINHLWLDPPTGPCHLSFSS